MYNKNAMPFLVCERPSFAMRKAVFHAPIDGLSHRKKPFFYNVLIINILCSRPQITHLKPVRQDRQTGKQTRRNRHFRRLQPLYMRKYRFCCPSSRPSLKRMFYRKA